MKAVFALVLLFAVAYGRSTSFSTSQGHMKRDLGTIMTNFKREFAWTDMQNFMNALKENLGDRISEFKKSLVANQGKMDVTLRQWRDELGDDYPELKEKYLMVQERMEYLADKISTMTVRDVLQKVGQQFGIERINKQKINNFFDELKKYVEAGMDAAQSWSQRQHRDAQRERSE